MNSPRFLAVLSVSGLCLALPAVAQVAEQETIKSLEDKTIEVKPSKLNLDNSELARQSYRDFLEEHPRIDLADVCYTAATGRRRYSRSGPSAG